MFTVTNVQGQKAAQLCDPGVAVARAGWSCTLKQCMQSHFLNVFKGGMKQKLGHSPTKEFPIKKQIKWTASTPQVLYKCFVAELLQSGETGPNRVKHVRVKSDFRDPSPKFRPNFGKQGNPNS